MRDVQNLADHRNIPLEEAGIAGLRYPVTVLDRHNSLQSTVAEISMSVSLPHHYRGTHMSRFIEVLEESGCVFQGSTIPALLGKLRKVLDAGNAKIRIAFPYFMERTAPVTGASAKMVYSCVFQGESSKDKEDFLLTVTVPVGTLCPCSREISSHGAHNQRGFVTLEVRTRKLPDGTSEIVWIEELVELAEKSASSPLYTLLKRADEKFVTEQAYGNPAFAEDIVRNAAEMLMEDPRVTGFRVRAENHESIHGHNAYAVVAHGEGY